MRGMPEETLLAFDYGVKKIGVAIGNTLTRQARPLEILMPVTRDQRFAAIARIADRLAARTGHGGLAAYDSGRGAARHLCAAAGLPISCMGVLA